MLSTLDHLPTKDRCSESFCISLPKARSTAVTLQVCHRNTQDRNQIKIEVHSACELGLESFLVSFKAKNLNRFPLLMLI